MCCPPSPLSGSGCRVEVCIRRTLRVRRVRGILGLGSGRPLPGCRRSSRADVLRPRWGAMQCSQLGGRHSQRAELLPQSKQKKPMLGPMQ